MRKKRYLAVGFTAVLTAVALLLTALCCMRADADSFGSTVYLRTDKTKTPYIYFWIDGQTGFPGWPGSAMTADGDNIYSYDLPCDIGDLTGVIFNSDKNGTKMTGDVKNITGNLYDLASGTWETYPVKFESYGTDIKSVYVGSRVKIYANATSPYGSVKYRFSVNNSVVSDYSDTNSVIWEPKKAEKTTLLFEAKDSSGNVNSCEMTVDVKDSVGAVDPIFLSAVPENGKIVKAGEKVSILINGTGGQVNNKILFYKTEVIAPDGSAVNTPYYKTDNTAEFTPELKGDYTIKMYIQNNTVENTTAYAEYTYTCNDGKEPTPKPIETDSDVTSKPSPVESDSDVTSKPVPIETADGDYDGDGKVELEDAYKLQDDVTSHKKFTKDEISRADMNNDGKLTLKDASLIMRAAKG